MESIIDELVREEEVAVDRASQDHRSSSSDLVSKHFSILSLIMYSIDSPTVQYFF